MRTFIIFLTSFILACAQTQAPQVPQVPQPYPDALCDTYKEVISNLAEGFSEVPKYGGLTPSGLVIQVLVSEEGTWSLVVVRPDGITCIVAIGEDWHAITPRRDKEIRHDTR